MVTRVKERPRPCGCQMEAFEHDGGCQRVHLMKEEPGLLGRVRLVPLCGMDTYKVNRVAPVRRAGLENRDEVCLVCASELQRGDCAEVRDCRERNRCPLLVCNYDEDRGRCGHLS